ncbi:hypothetical protein DFH05DRAFT_1530638 [Lentinula detonsa]|uniref:Uncharacterized protein n=1 Tax=Lentinula detonsa TaxID=2804962 RepID=A0A9W8NQY9_9AGAR|nr:hypothetical protein DFH05DRAFT_1530638 [Lentinula detonsa]
MLFTAGKRYNPRSVLLAEERPASAYDIKLDKQSDIAVECKGDFTWDVVLANNVGTEIEEPNAATAGQKKTGPETHSKQEKNGRKKAKKDCLPTTVQPDSDLPDQLEMPLVQPFQLKDLDFMIRKGAFVAIIGRVGSGKTSILQAHQQNPKCIICISGILV